MVEMKSYGPKPNIYSGKNKRNGNKTYSIDEALNLMPRANKNFYFSDSCVA